MAPFRNRDRSNRSGRGQIEHNVLEGLPITQYREAEITIEPHSAENKPLDKDAWPELPMPRDSHMLPEHSQQLLRAARSGKLYKPPAPPEEDNEMKDEEEETKEIRTGFTIKKYVKVARHLEGPEPEYLAKRRKGLPSPYVSTQVAQPALRETKVKKLDAEGNVAVYKVLVPEGQSVEGEVQPTDAAIEVAPATAAPGTVVEGIGVVNAEGIVVAKDIVQQTPPRRRPPPPKKVKRGGPGRGKKKVVFAEGSAEQGTPASTSGGDMLEVPGVKREEGSVAPSDGGDTPMADAGGNEEEGSGEEGSEDEDHDMERTSTPATPATPLRSTAPPSTSAMDISDTPEATPSAPVVESSIIVPTETSTEAPTGSLVETPTETAMETTQPAETTNEPSHSIDETEKATVQTATPETAQEAPGRDKSSSPDMPLSSISHSRQNSLNDVPAAVTATEIAVPEDIPSEVPAPTVEADAAPAPPVASEPGPAAEPVPESAPEPVPVPASEPVPESVPETAPEPAPEPAQEPAAKTEPEQTLPDAPSPQASEPDLMGSLEAQLEKDNDDMNKA
ncbi:hypothetical protein yc1106_09832 [Curvularia clavata]|uniref:Uncharacterized protein n=1 Tax=Curvularia clavata TaxID=95742 RepID=A0A9Q8ZKW3_CURCL|nr:hypothetical protein yc1106_09832 [Curvularia clavata]